MTSSAPVDVLVPELGESVFSVTIEDWVVSVGDKVAAGDPIVDVSTDKVDTSIDSPAAGIVASLHAEVGDELSTGALLARIQTA